MQIVPIVDEDRRFTTWFIDDIYTGQPGSTGRYVPNVNDLVMSYSTGFWRCTQVDYETGFSVLVPWSFTNITDSTSNTDIIVGGNSTINDYYRIYVNTKVVPYEFSIDARLKIYGSDVTYIKIFKNGELSGSSISAEFNSAGALVSENIKLENVIIPNTVVTAIKTPKQGHLVEKPADGEVLNVVAYSNSGAVRAIFKVVTVVTNFVRTIDASKKLITDITLISPYLSKTDRTLLEYPSNMTLDSSALIGCVTYNDGSVQRYPIDGKKFKLLGRDNYVVSQLGQTVPLVLSYTLSADEYSNVLQQSGNNRFVTKSYRLTTVDSDNLYSVKLFVVPYWIQSSSKWALDFYLYNLDRDYVYNVTPYIEYQTNTPVFDGSVTKWGVTQNLTVAINLDKLGGSFKYYRHVAEFAITLHQAGENYTASGYYTLAYDTDSIFGGISYAEVKTAGNGYTIDMSGGRTLVDNWLDTVYRSTSPLYFPYSESRAPTPTHVKIIIGQSWSREIPISDVLLPITGVNPTEGIKTGTLIRLEFIANYTTSRLQLATVGLVAKL